jgi:lipopolysaccharide/colanic/teichoic acid biosynthesis glycosyltransferase
MEHEHNDGRKIWALYVKRITDLLISAVFLVILFPALVIVALLVWRYCGAPVFFTQMRPGLGGKPFRLIKFRTMSNARNADGSLKSDAERLTTFGRFLRSSSIDELPELWNILVGDMALVGPRPLLSEYLPLYNSRQARRHDVRPGLTGWAQINGRNAISWDEKFELDVWYVEHQSFWLDCRILLRTAWAVLRREGISAAGDATMPVFKGDQSR